MSDAADASVNGMRPRPRLIIFCHGVSSLVFRLKARIQLIYGSKFNWNRTSLMMPVRGVYGLLVTDFHGYTTNNCRLVGCSPVTPRFRCSLAFCIASTGTWSAIPSAKRVVEVKDARLFFREDLPDALATAVLQFWDELGK